MSNLRLYYKSDYKIRETFKTQESETIDPRTYNFTFVFRAGVAKEIYDIKRTKFNILDFVYTAFGGLLGILILKLWMNF